MIKNSALTLPDWLTHSGTTESLCEIVLQIANTAREIAGHLQHADLGIALGAAGQQNACGDDVKALDILANEKYMELISAVDAVYSVGSEEYMHIEPVHKDGTWTVWYDPLDGSSNIDAHIATGTIFSITDACRDTHMLPTGRDITVAGYILFSSATVLMLSVGEKPAMFVLEPVDGSWICVRQNVTIPETIKCYSINEANLPKLSDTMREIVDGWRKQATGRYIGSMVADVHRNLLYGGIFSYPGDRGNPKGKLRTLYECQPIGWLYEKAGGAGSNGYGSVLDLRAEELHDRTPVFLGPKRYIESIEKRMGADR